jgi:starvation-inducible DNA-binding protein
MNTLDYIGLDAAKAGKTVELLQQLLADYQVFYSNLRGFHWDIKGRNFFTLHSKFEDMYNDAAEKVDEIAERILMLSGVPANKFSDYLKIAKIKEVSGVTCGDEAVGHILDTYKALIASERVILAHADEAGDESTSNLMSDYLEEQEKTVWMLVAYSTSTCKE